MLIILDSKKGESHLKAKVRDNDELKNYKKQDTYGSTEHDCCEECFSINNDSPPTHVTMKWKSSYSECDCFSIPGIKLNIHSLQCKCLVDVQNRWSGSNKKKEGGGGNDCQQPDCSIYKEDGSKAAYECQPATCSGRKKRSVVLSSQREVTCEDWSTHDTSSKYWKWDYTVPDACWRKFLPRIPTTPFPSRELHQE
jgi:hypothetical protein